MSALDAMTAHNVISELGTLVSREQMSYGTRFPLVAQHRRATEPCVWVRAVHFARRLLEISAVTRQVAHLPPHMLRDIGLDPENMALSIEQRVSQFDAMKHKARLVA